MTPERWQEIKVILARMQEISPERRDRFLDDACGSDEDLRAEVLSLFRAYHQSGPVDELVECLSGPHGRLPDDTPIPEVERVLHYEIIRQLGSGGMGVVYEARDERLGRHVALKFLPESISQDENARKRFLREARSAAAIDHPYICKIFEIGEWNGKNFIAMELVRGKTLEQRLKEGPIGLEQSLQLASEIAEALEEAHREGIIHRDLKPSNIMLARDGHIKVMDFGLAKPLPPIDDATRVEGYTGLTGSGIRLGTVPYMSPEQLEGLDVDARSDIFAFGILLFEMVTGMHPFRRQDGIETAHAILREDPPPVTGYSTGVSELLSYVVRKMLAKKPRQRYQSALDVQNDLREILRILRGAEGPQIRFRLRRSWKSILLAGGLVVAAAVIFLLLWESSPPVPAPILRADLSLPEGLRLSHFYRTGLAVSPDGTMVAFVAGSMSNPYVFPEQTQIYVRRLDGWQARPVSGTLDSFQPFFSPDGEWLGFTQYDRVNNRFFLKKVRVSGGEPVSLCECETRWGASWGSGGDIVFGSGNDGLFRVSASGGDPLPLTFLDRERGEIAHRLPHFLPDGRSVLFTSPLRNDALDSQAHIFIYSLDSGERKLLVEGWDARYAPTGHLVFAREGSIRSVAFDPHTWTVSGPEVTVLEGVTHSIYTVNPTLRTGAAQMAFSESGLLVFTQGTVFPEIKGPVVWVDRTGREEPLEMEPRNFLTARISPDGNQVLLTTIYPPQDVWMYDTGRQTIRRQTFDERTLYAIWGPVAGQFTYTSSREAPRPLFTRQLDSGLEQGKLLAPELDVYVRPSAWTPDGKALLVVTSTPETSFDIALLHPGGELEWVMKTRFIEQYPELSPAGRWLVYTSDQSGRHEVYVRGFPERGRTLQISTDGGIEPAWSRDGREIIYRWRNEFFSVALKRVGEDLTAAEPEKLFEGNYGSVHAVRSFDVGPDGRFIVVKRPDDSALEAALDQFFPERIQLIQNWFQDLQARNPAQ